MLFSFSEIVLLLSLSRPAYHCLYFKIIFCADLVVVSQARPQPISDAGYLPPPVSRHLRAAHHRQQPLSVPVANGLGGYA